MKRLLCFCILLAAFGCEREQRRFHEPPPLQQLSTGGAQNPDVVPGTASRPPAALTPAAHNPYEHNAYMVAQGKHLYIWMNCNGCHAMGGGGMGPPLMDGQWIYGAEPAAIYSTIIEGRPNGMPSYRGKLTEQQTWQLVAYVRSMSALLPKDVRPGRSDNMQTRPPEVMRDPERPSQRAVPQEAQP